MALQYKIWITKYASGVTTHISSNSRECKFNKKNLLLVATRSKGEKENRIDSTDSKSIAPVVISYLSLASPYVLQI